MAIIHHLAAKLTGAPAVCTLVGDSAAARAYWQTVCLQLPADAIDAPPRRETVVPTLLGAINERGGLFAASVRWIARRANAPLTTMAILGSTRREREQRLRDAFAGPARSPTERLCELVLLGGDPALELTAGDVAALSAVVDELLTAWPWADRIAAIDGLLTVTPPTVGLLLDSHAAAVDPLEAARLAGELAVAAPCVAVGWSVAHDAFRRISSSAADRAIGLCTLNVVDVSTVIQPNPAAATADFAGDATDRDAGIATSREQLKLLDHAALLASFEAAVEAARRVTQVAASASLDGNVQSAGRQAATRARSLAEAHLFAELQAHPQTRGRFALNATLPIAFGQRPLEIDLLSRELAMAIEVDGYWHFQDDAAFRRDRRKDVVMQQNGLLVLRVLADDVLTRRGEVLAQIVSAVRQQHRRSSHRE